MLYSILKKEGFSMIQKIKHSQLGRSNLGWLNSWFHFSFAEYYNPDKLQFGMLRVVNDDLIQPNSGFDTHPHKDMEIITYVVNGVLTHQDDMGNQRTLRRGEVQYMSAGTGVLHREMNFGRQVLRLLQIWILPDRIGHSPRYGEYRFIWEKRRGNWLHMVSGETTVAPIQIHQDMNIYATEILAGESVTFEIQNNRQAYLILIEGAASVNSIALEERDALTVKGSESLQMITKTTAHCLLFEMAQE